ncbi:hypothetical protein GUITHDRAFT_153580 [Guillardia theta CCMP2712]|uniref:Uncharacterized protein n=1 Tax=Guillardia theta (strain CCMP2712) TaxID=905079 RepID=L1J1D2_GUITC|nr:hypothetical protein GUITHDRAFT_153580 [Guillardia theta CCMP2712]EKX42306.1 hypothetical protein GUITHDRAFT_153580 [Guillardia theta CCMP2712]|eukprot:XP_005829286.1 hypothetical protein GUITHDRAFT_153580 [Guillardia theta CCMP2712]
MHFKDSNWYSTEGNSKDQLSNNKWFSKSQALAGDKNLIKKEGNWAWHNNVTCADYGCYAQWKGPVAFL